jgi:hypothetical protein
MSLPVQEHLNELSVGPQPQMGLIYAEILMIALVALTYGSGLPLMYGVVCLVCVAVYWTEKHKFLKVYCMPVEYGKRITSLFVRVLRVRPPPPSMPALRDVFLLRL